MRASLLLPATNARWSGRENSALILCINHYQQKISQEVRKITNFEGVDIVIEHVGPATWQESVRSLKAGGTLVTCGATTGPKVELDLRFLFSRQLALLGSYMGTMSELHEVLGHVFAGRLKPVIDRDFPAAERFARRTSTWRRARCLGRLC